MAQPRKNPQNPPSEATPQVSPARLVPRAAFGLSAALLAGVVVVAVQPGGPAAKGAPEQVLAAAGLSAPINEVIGGDNPALTTCCPPN